MTSKAATPDSSGVSRSSTRRRPIVWAILAVCWFAFAAVDLEYGIDFMSPLSLLPCFALLIAIVIAITELFRGLGRDNRGVFNWALLVAALLVLEMFAVGIVSQVQRQWTIAAAEPVVAAIRAYRDANGEYPESLDQLTPGYIESIPKSEMGWGIRPLRYSRFKLRDSEEAFSLAFSGHAGLSTVYLSTVGKWKTDD